MIHPTFARCVWFAVYSATHTRQLAWTLAYYSHGLHAAFLQQHDDWIVQNLAATGAWHRSSTVHV